jgi:hypothetical protein
MIESQHWSRPEPERTKPYRNGWSEQPKLREVADMATTTVEQAVSIGYDIIEDNIERGRSYARRRHHADEHASQDLPDDLLKLTTRLVRMGRDFSMAYFDLIEKTVLDLATRSTRTTPDTSEYNPEDD